MPGFPPQTVAFLSALSERDEPDWLDQDRDTYEAAYVRPARAFADAALDELTSIAPQVQGEARVGGSILDVDRARGDQLRLVFWEGANRRTAVSSFFLNLGPSTVEIGAGARTFGRERLKVYREAVAHPRAGACLVDVTTALSRSGFDVNGERYERTPRGYDLTGERERLVRFGALWGGIEVEHPSILHSRRFLRWCVARWTKLADLHRWLVDEVG